MVQLTRYLYFLDESLYSLLFSVIKAQENTFKEVAFWCGEIYYSGFHEELTQFIWKIYYDFYAITYPKYEKKIRKKLQVFNIDNIIYILNMLYYSRSNPDVFQMRHYKPKFPNHIWLTKPPPSWLKDMCLTKLENKFIRSVHNQKKTNIVFYLNMIPVERCMEIITQYYQTVHGHLVKPNNQTVYKDEKHVLLSLIQHLSLDASNIHTKMILKKIDNTIITEQILLNDDVVEPLYKTLGVKRLFKVSSLIGAFELQRFSIENMDHRDILWCHWDYFAYNTPLWKKRIDECNGIRDDDSRELIFKNDRDHEKFYETYNYEPDEQTKEIQDMSIGLVDVECGKLWIEKMMTWKGIVTY